MNDDRAQDWERAMSNEFDRRVRDLNEAPLTMAHVKGAATSIKRKRRAALAGSVLAAAAVIAPVAVLALNNDDQPRTIQPANPTPTVATESSEPIPAPTPPSTPAPTVSETPKVFGDGIGVDYLEDRTLVRADGSVMDLPNTYQDGATVGDDMFLGVAYGDEGIFIEEVDGNGSFVGFTPALSSVASNDDHTVAAYVNEDGSVELRSATERDTVPVTFEDGATPVTVVGDANCIGEESCLVFINPGTEAPPSVVSQDGTAAPLTNGIRTIMDAQRAEGPSVGVVSVQDQGTCNSVFGGTGGEALFENCDYRYFDFSPGEDFLSGAQSYGDGFGDAWAGIYDASDGTEIARYDPPSEAIVDSQWQDENHLLVLSFEFDANIWRVTSLGLDGSEEPALAPIEADQDVSPIILLD